MKFAYTIVYVADVSDTLMFYQRAFGFAPRFLHESGQYGELDTGATTLAFASHALGDSHFGATGYQKLDPASPPPAMRWPACAGTALPPWPPGTPPCTVCTRTAPPSTR